MRLFLAVDLPTKIKKDLDKQLEDIKKEYAHLNWVPQENYHLTLHFFGETNDIGNIKNKVEEAIFDANSFNLYSFNADLFLNSKIVLYISFRREKVLEKLVSAVMQHFSIKEKEGQKFVPHLTVARYKIPSKQQYLLLKKKLNQLDIEIAFPVRKIYLFESILTGKKPVYKKIAVFPLLKQRQF